MASLRHVQAAFGVCNSAFKFANLSCGVIGASSGNDALLSASRIS
jgi:hypothetical protein